MDSLGERLMRDRRRVDDLIQQAKEHEKLARDKYEQAHEIERVMELIRRQS